jgi:hypothetical protein
MQDDVIADLKQFIAATVSQATAELVTNQKLEQSLEGLRSDMDKRFDDLEAKVDAIADAHAETLGDHEQRLKRLEQRAA